LLAVSAGAIYIEGQAPVVDDGQLHILAAESGISPGSVVTPSDEVLVPTAYTSGPIKRYLSNDPNDYVLVPGNEPGMVYALGDMGTAPDSVTTTMPVVSMPQAGTFAIPYDTIGAEIGGIMNSPAVAFSMPDMALNSWYGSGLNNFNVNMPLLSFPVL
jgi:hypothetical protein